MKFIIAASIVAQSLPVLSEKVSSKLLTQAEQPELLSQFIAKIAKLRLAGKTAFRSSLAGARLSGATLEIPKDCDPSSEDPDVGILSCDVGYECVSDDASGVGGVCMSIISRELQDKACRACPDGDLDAASINLKLNIPAFPDIVTCGFINFFLSNVTSTSEDCAYLPPFLQASGCCQGGPYFQCDICDGGTLTGDVSLQDGNETITCFEAAAFAPESDCSAFKPVFASLCCEGAPTAAPNMDTVPTAGSTTTWTASTRLTMMGLAAATAAALAWN
jgi:hypothetical protein